MISYLWDISYITHGFVKKTQKTPRREIERAKRYRQDYMERVKMHDEL
ncbi:type II toxin-antitoxin system RelE/ParE family toxin [Mitsuokella jalaludinii]|nr:type II toxin-antitoxin system RelE/ParE family toxin [Mitsuokella jalaludinii]